MAAPIDIKTARLARLKRAARPRRAHIFQRAPDDHYVEPDWCGAKLFDAERFDPSATILDPACGWGRVVKAAMIAGYRTAAADIADRGIRERVPGAAFRVANFLTEQPSVSAPFNVTSNPPYCDDSIQRFAERALELGATKVALMSPLARIVAARWLQTMPLARVWLLTPRPSVPPGEHILAGGKVGGGGLDFCWLVFELSYRGEPVIRWLHRDGRRT